ncbi:MAG: cytidine deaminase [Planctomycetota bacterium]
MTPPTPLPRPLKPDARDALIAAARDVARRAYAPASRFAVGAALLTEDGRIVAGCNVENASYGLSICAERSAVFRMVAEGQIRVVAIAVWTPLDPPGSPCGACRQVLSEFAGPECAVILCGSGNTVVELSLGALLPRPFSFRDLNGPNA